MNNTIKILRNLVSISSLTDEILYFSAPKLKGRPRRKRKKRDVSPAGESSNESEASVASSVAASTSKGSSTSSGPSAIGRPPSRASSTPSVASVKKCEKIVTDEEKRFVADVNEFMTTRNTPILKIPLLGYRQSELLILKLHILIFFFFFTNIDKLIQSLLFFSVDLFLFYTKVQELGGYDRVSRNRLWKAIYDELGGNAGSTSAATITRKHYERWDSSSNFLNSCSKQFFTLKIFQAVTSIRKVL